jgi:hypothetical protein
MEKFAHHLITPYICIDLNLDEQLVHLSTAAHLALYLYHDNSARTKFMPSQSYIDIMLMIKNVYFCIAKVKIDSPSGKFYIILLGTDRLEIFFGFIRTAVGTDTNVDMIQLGSRASGLTEVAIILAEHPEWDHGPRRLRLPAISKDSGDITSKVDHINPASWRGNVEVTNVNLQTCWLLGRRKAVELIPEADSVFDQLSQVQGVDILSPFGEILVNQRDLEDEYDYSELAADYNTSETPILSTEHLSTEASVPYTQEGDMEDAMAEEMPRNQIISEIIIAGQKTTKAKALRHRMMYQTSRASTDRLKCVQHISCFNPIISESESPELESSTIISFDGTLGAPCLRIGNPIAILVQCEGHVFLAVAQVNRLRFASKNDLHEIAIHLLVDDTAKVDFQILCLISATVENDPEQVHDWCWSFQMESLCENIPGRFAHPINPTISVRTPGKPTYLFESSFLVALSSSLHQDLLPQDRKILPVVKRSDYFPYRNSGP